MFVHYVTFALGSLSSSLLAALRHQKLPTPVLVLRPEHPDPNVRAALVYYLDDVAIDLIAEHAPKLGEPLALEGDVLPDEMAEYLTIRLHAPPTLPQRARRIQYVK